MAESPQHPLQIMENQTRFDLNAAVENWRQELAAQPPLTPDNRRELETHLRDALTELKARGLGDEESFWLARRRVGQPKQLMEEFAKANPAEIWRSRILWSLVVLFVVYFWRSFVTVLYLAILPDHAPNSHFYDGLNIQSVVPDWLLGQMAAWQKEICEGLLNNLSPAIILYLIEESVFCLPIVWLAFSVARGRTAMKFFAWRSLFNSRRRFVIAASTLVLIFQLFQSSISALRTLRMVQHSISSGGSVSFGGKLIAQPNWAQFFWHSLFSINTLIYPVVFIFVIAYLLPAQNRKAPKRA